VNAVYGMMFCHGVVASIATLFLRAIPAAPMHAEVTLIFNLLGAVLEPLVATNKRHLDSTLVVVDPKNAHPSSFFSDPAHHRNAGGGRAGGRRAASSGKTSTENYAQLDGKIHFGSFIHNLSYLNGNFCHFDCGI
jgi:hypothetical protein